MEGRPGGPSGTDEISVAARREGAVVTILVQDTGPGVPEHLKGKLDGVAMRVPTPNVSVVDLKFVAKRPTTVEEIQGLIKDASESNKLKGILGCYEEPLVSIDFNHDPHSSMFALNEAKVIDGTLVRVMSWYDNEWGFASRMADTAVKMQEVG